MELNANLANGVETPPQPQPDVGNRLNPLPVPRARRKINLDLAVLPEPGAGETVEVLSVREMKGIGATFTPNITAMLTFFGIAYKPPGEFDTVHQILAGPLQNDSRVLRLARRIAFVPAYDWRAHEVVLHPIKLPYGQRVQVSLQKLQPRFPYVKVFIYWAGSKQEVKPTKLTEQEKGIIDQVRWPDREQILDALEVTSFDNIEDLAAANEDVRTFLGAEEAV